MTSCYNTNFCAHYGKHINGKNRLKKSEHCMNWDHFVRNEEKLHQ